MLTNKFIFLFSITFAAMWIDLGALKLHAYQWITEVASRNDVYIKYIS